jgi:hypothetical protein
MPVLTPQSHQKWGSPFAWFFPDPSALKTFEQGIKQLGANGYRNVLSS